MRYRREYWKSVSVNATKSSLGFPHWEDTLNFCYSKKHLPTFHKQTYKRKENTSADKDETEQPDMVDLHAKIEQCPCTPTKLEQKEHTTQLEVRQPPAAACDTLGVGATSPNQKTGAVRPI